MRRLPPFRSGLSVNRSARVRPSLAQIASGKHPAWQCSTTPFSPSATERLARRSLCAGQRACQPLPDFLTADSLARMSAALTPAGLRPTLLLELLRLALALFAGAFLFATLTPHR